MLNKFQEMTMDQKMSKSAAFVALYNEGHTVAEISRVTSCHYSFVRGAVQAAIKKGTAIEQKSVKTDSKAAIIRELASQGLSTKEICMHFAKELDVYINSSYVSTVVRNG